MSWFALPDDVMEDAWFTPERLWRTAWIGKNVLRSTNCIAGVAQISKPLSVLSKEWDCTIKVVRTTLEGLEKRGMIRVQFGKVKGKLQTLITCLFSRFYDESKIMKGTERARSGHGEGHIYKEEENLRKEGKGRSRAPDPSHRVNPDPFGDEAQEPDGAGPTEQPASADPSTSEERADSPPVPPPPSRKPRTKRKAERAPLEDDWRPSARTWEWATKDRGKDGALKIGASEADLEEEIEKFLNYYIYGPGQSAPWSDWNKCFQQWMSKWKKGGGAKSQKSFSQQRYESEFKI